jgi:hypothetical protein
MSQAPSSYEKLPASFPFISRHLCMPYLYECPISHSHFLFPISRNLAPRRRSTKVSCDLRTAKLALKQVTIKPHFRPRPCTKYPSSLHLLKFTLPRLRARFCLFTCTSHDIHPSTSWTGPFHFVFGYFFHFSMSLLCFFFGSLSLIVPHPSIIGTVPSSNSHSHCS